MGDITKGYTFSSGETVTPAKLNSLADNATLNSGTVTTAKMVDGCVTTGKLADVSVTTGKMADASVTMAKLDATPKNGFAKAWASFSGTAPGTGLVAFNVTSVTRNSAGDYTVTMPSGTVSNANYAVVGNCTTDGSFNAITVMPLSSAGATYQAPTTTSFRVYTHRAGTGALDPNRVFVVVYGT